MVAAYDRALCPQECMQGDTVWTAKLAAHCNLVMATLEKSINRIDIAIGGLMSERDGNKLTILPYHD